MRVRGFIALTSACLALGVASPASAAPSKGETLFREGKAAMDKNDFATACAKFQESYDAERAPSSLLSLANCEEKRGRLAQALAFWEQGVAEAKDDDTRSLATDRGNQLRPRVPKIVVHVGTPDAKNPRVRVDGKDVLPDREVPVDPGDHVVQASADGTVAEEVHSQGVEGQTAKVTVLASIARPVEVKPPADPGATLKLAGLVTGGVGVAGIIVFGATGIAVLADDECGDFVCPKAQRPQGTLIANAVSLVVGIAGLGAGVTLYVVGSVKSKQAAAAVRLQPLPGGGRVGAVFDF